MGQTQTQATAPERLLWHPVRLDEQGKLLAWPDGPAPFDTVVTRAWQTFLRIPVQPNGYRTYITYPVFYGPGDPEHPLFSGRAWTHNPASLFAMLTDSALLYYAYSGQRAVMDRVGEMIDHHIAMGSTGPEDAWVCVPYASADAQDPVYRGANEERYAWEGEFRGRGDGVGFIEPDKVGELGLAYVQFYEYCGKEKYLQAARRCADALARHATPGDEAHSPWPFRVDAATGAQVREAYTANTIGPIRLLDEMIRLGEGDTAAYRHARALAWEWLMTYPMRNNVWTQYFEDIYIYPDYRTNINQYCPLETARYLMSHPELDPQWREHVAGLLEWVRGHFAIDSFTMAGLPEKGMQWGAEAVSEQINDMDKMSSHTARYGSVLARWHECGGPDEARERALRSLNWATYSCREDGLVKTSLDEGTGYWFSDGYGDYMRHFMRAMASVPAWAPAGEDHLLRSSSVVRWIVYGHDRITYQTFDRQGRERLKLRGAPREIKVGGLPVELRETLTQGEPGYTLQPVEGGGYLIDLERTRPGAVELILEHP